MCEESLASILFNIVKCGIIVIDYETRLVVDINPAACLMFGVSRDSIVNTHCQDSICAELDNRCPINGISDVENELISIIRRDGSVVQLLRTVNTVFWNGRKVIVENFLDVTLLKKTEDCLTKERDRSQLYLDTASSIFVALDRSGNVTLMNQKGCEILGVNEEDVLGINWFDKFIPEKERESVREVFDKLMSGEFNNSEVYYENTIIDSKGEYHIIKWHNAVIRNGGPEIISTLSSGEDITEQRKAEQELLKIWDEAEKLLSKNFDDLIKGSKYISASYKDRSMELDKALSILNKEV